MQARIWGLLGGMVCCRGCWDGIIGPGGFDGRHGECDTLQLHAGLFGCGVAWLMGERCLAGR